MSRVIKGSLFPSADGVYVIDPDKIARKGRFRPGKTASPEEAAASILDQAREEAAALIASAKQEADSIREAACQEGYQSGLDRLEQERSALADRFAEIETQSAEQIEEQWAALEPELLKLAVEIAAKIVRQEVSANQELVLNTVKAGLRQLRDRRELKIRVNPADYEFVRERRDDIAGSCDGVRSLEVIDDRRVDQGGCIIESSNGHLDGRIETQVCEVERALMEAAHDGKCDTSQP